MHDYGVNKLRPAPAKEFCSIDFLENRISNNMLTAKLFARAPVCFLPPVCCHSAPEELNQS